MSGHVARVVKNYPQKISFFITLLGNIVSIIIGIIFSTAVLRFSQEWATDKNQVTVFHVSLLSAFRNQSWPWGIKDHKYLLLRNRWLSVVLAGGCIAAFAMVPSGTTSLITPVSFHRTWNLTGTELDSSSNADCVQWFIENDLHTLTSLYYGFQYSTNFDRNDQNQLVVLLESGRNSVSRQHKIIHN